jgi:hypothetical protein
MNDIRRSEVWCCQMGLLVFRSRTFAKMALLLPRNGLVPEGTLFLPRNGLVPEGTLFLPRIGLCFCQEIDLCQKELLVLPRNGLVPEGTLFLPRNGLAPEGTFVFAKKWTCARRDLVRFLPSHLLDFFAQRTTKTAEKTGPNKRTEQREPYKQVRATTVATIWKC